MGCFTGLFNSTVKVKRVTLLSSGGQETLQSTFLDVKCYIDEMDSLTSQAGGTGKASSTKIITETEILLDDRIWLPGLDTTVEQYSRAPDSVHVLRDIDGSIAMYEVVL